MYVVLWFLCWKLLSHVFFGSFLTSAAAEDVQVFSNIESGDGRPDIKIIFSSNQKKVIIFEFKKSLYEKSLNKDAETALEQIVGGKYFGADFKICDCLAIGVSFFEKGMSDLKHKYFKNGKEV